MKPGLRHGHRAWAKRAATGPPVAAGGNAGLGLGHSLRVQNRHAPFNAVFVFSFGVRG